ncbi:MAG: ABC transporter ATP-binding protein [Moorellales bacterium]
MRILEIEDLTKRFGGLVAVNNLSLHVEEGEIVGLIGPNGAGKTTVFNLVSGALVPDEGRIRFKGREIGGRKPHQICRLGVARTFQSVRIFPSLTVYENVLTGCVFGAAGRVAHSEVAREVEAALEFVGLDRMAAAPARDLTLVNQKRLEVARALACRPELLLLDEMMAGLNPAEVGEAMELIGRIRERGITVVMIEHVMKAIMTVCHRIVVLHHGEKIAEGKPEEVAQNRQVIEVYLGE